MLDFHCHSNYSDGAHSLDELMDMAIVNNLAVIALTDHDCLEGIEPFIQLGQQRQVKVISGVELSVNWKKKDIHIVGLNFDYKHAEITKAISYQSEQRIIRAKAMCEALSFLKIPDLYQQALDLTTTGYITRPHIAQVLINSGICKSMDQAFDYYLKRGKPGYVHTAWLSLQQAVAAIVDSGGIAVIAHPLKYQLSATKLNQLIEAFIACGGKAIEVVSGRMPANQINQMAQKCNHYRLYASSGSDFHRKGQYGSDLGLQSSLPESVRSVYQLIREEL